MKKATIGSVFIVLVFVIVVYSDFFYLGSMKDNITSKETSNSQTTFSAKKGDKINFTCKSSVKQGDIKLTLINPSGKVIKNFPINTNHLEQVYLDTDGQYTFAITYDNFVGNYNVKYK